MSRVRKMDRKVERENFGQGKHLTKIESVARWQASFLEVIDLTY